MKIKVVIGESQKDEEALHFSYCTMFGLGYEKTIAIYYPSTNILEVHPNYAGILAKILNALRIYRVAEHSMHKPIKVEYWA